MLEGRYGKLTMNQDGSYSYEANRADAIAGGSTAMDIFIYTVTGASDSTTASLAITVTGVNDGPVAADDEADVEEGATVTGSVIDGEPANNGGPGCGSGY